MEIRPFVVKYKAGTDKSIKPGIHGKFETMEDALNGLEKCTRHFGSLVKKSATLYAGPAICGIVVDDKALEQQQKLEKQSDDLQCDLPEPEQSELDRMKAEIDRLKIKAGEAEEPEGEEECEASFDSASEETPKPAKSKKSPRTSFATVE